jgi:hypothetical protein
MVGGLAGLALLSATVADRPHLALAMGARLTLLLLFYLYTVNRTMRDSGGSGWAQRQFAGAMAPGIAVQGVVALGQTLRQASLGLNLLGERVVDLRTSGVAVVEAYGRHWLRPYGLTAHPNVLGGFAAASLLPIALWLPRGAARLAVPGCAGLLLLTLSRGAGAAVAALHDQQQGSDRDEGHHADGGRATGTAGAGDDHRYRTWDQEAGHRREDSSW